MAEQEVSASPTLPGVIEVCRKFKERSENLGFTGKRRDNAALEYVCGACTGARAAGNAALAKHLEVFVFLTSVRGAVELLHIANEHEAAPTSIEESTNA